MKLFICDTIIDTKDFTTLELEEYLQQRYDDWLGKDRITLHVTDLEQRKVGFVVSRKYGSWYEDPKRFSTYGKSILDWDEQLITGEGYVKGGIADFETHTGRYIIRDSVETMFLPQYKRIHKKFHCSRIRKIEYEEWLDHFTVSFEVV